MIFQIFLVVCLAYIGWRWMKNRGLPPGPFCLPIIGYLPWLDPKKPYVSLTELSKKFGPIYGLYLGSLYTVVISDVKLVRQALAKSAFAGRAPLYVTHGIMQGNGLICAEGELWKEQRKFVINTMKNFGINKFGPKVKQIEGIIQEGIDEFIHKCDEEISGKNKINVDPLGTLRHCLGNLMNYIVLGLKWDEDDPIWKWLQQLQEDGVKLIGVSGPLNFLPFLRFIPSMISNMKFLMDGQIKTHRLYLNIIEKYSKSKKIDEKIHSDHFIDAFLEERSKRQSETSLKHFSDQQFVHLLSDLFGAGLDTTFATLCWFFLYTAKNQAIQSHICEELDYIVGKNRKPSVEDINSLPYLEACIAEVQRIRSVVPTGLPHGTTEDLIFEGYRIPKGSMVLPLQWAIHMNPEIWDEPENFNPSRFINEEGKFFKPEAFIPFQTGKRMCIGDEFARMILMLYISSILQKFTISLSENTPIDTEGECGLTLSPKHFHLEFVNRT